MTRDEYLRGVEYWLTDLPWSTRRDLLAEIRGQLDELPAGTDLKARLGMPEEYVAELRSAAGLERRRGPIAFLQARRPRNLVLTTVALIAVGLAIGAVVWVDSYQPITLGGYTQLPVAAQPFGQSVSVAFRKGQPFHYGITLQNSGRFAVRILGVPKSNLDFYSGRLLMSDLAHGFPPKSLERFHPFDLKPGESRWLLLDGVYACTTGTGKGTAITREVLPVRFSFLWRTATASIPLAEPLAFTFPKGCAPPKNPTSTP